VFLVACGRSPAPPRLSTAEAVVGPYVAVGFGAPLDVVKMARPSLAATGFRDGSRETFVDPSLEGGLEIETDLGRIRSVSLAFGPERGNDVERELLRGLGPGVPCASLPEGIGSFRPMLWHLPDGSAVALIRKQRVLSLRVEKPASAMFEAAWQTCAAESHGTAPPKSTP
jgi:hypothetical protein